MYVKLLISQVKSTRSLDGPSEHAICRSIFKHHARTYSELSPAQIGVLSLKAKAHIKHNIDDLSQSKEHIQARLSLLHTRQAELKAKDEQYVKALRQGVQDLDLLQDTMARNASRQRLLFEQELQVCSQMYWMS